MKLREQSPNLIDLDTKTFLSQIDFNTYILPLLNDIFHYYDTFIPLWIVLQYFNLNEIDSSITAKQVNCILPSHGTEDRHKSARYYSHDRETGEAIGSIYCFKCESLQRSSGILYQYIKNNDGSVFDFFTFCETTFKSPFPKDIVLDFDIEEYFSFQEDEDVKTNLLLEKALSTLSMRREMTSEQYLQQITSIYNGVL